MNLPQLSFSEPPPLMIHKVAVTLQGRSMPKDNNNQINVDKKRNKMH